ncbi:MAG: glycosyltransferase family 2 protein [Solirubrobacteraceae bacterium]
MEVQIVEARGDVARAIKVSVVVPVYNPGPHMDDLVRSVLGQSLCRAEYEVVFVDDGSTDGTAARLDELAARHRVVRVAHIPNSGWPGRPRNVGTDMARGEFVLFVDHDDWLGAEALKRLYDRAVVDGADVVVGKVVGRGKPVPRALFVANRSGLDVTWSPLLTLLSPHKLFRRAFLTEHGIRFPEGRRRLEDHAFVAEAYLRAAGRISVLADYPCYHWALRADRGNASWMQMDPAGYFANLGEVLDIVEARVPSGPLRDELFAHWYGSKALARLGGAAFLRREPAHNRDVYDEIRRLVQERFPARLDRFLSLAMRVRSHLVRTDSFAALTDLARFERSLKARVRLLDVEYDEAGVRLRYEARLRSPETRLVFRPHGSRIAWQPPREIAHQLDGADLDATDELRHATAPAVLRAVADRAEYSLPAHTATELVAGARGLIRPVVSATTRLDVRDAAAGAPLPDGEWELEVPVEICGFAAATRTMRTAGPDGNDRDAGRRAPLVFGLDERGLRRSA